MSGLALPPGLFDFIGRYQPPHPDMAPAVLRLTNADYHRLYRDAEGRALFHGPDRLLGLTIETDPPVPDGTWQILAADRTLLRDSRSTNEVPS